MTLQEFFEKNPKAAIAFSGGVDSSYLLREGLRLGKDIKAYYVKSQFQPEFEFADAKRLAEELGTNMQILAVDVLQQEAVIQNPPDRCYYCKQAIFGTILQAAATDGYSVILDGTNASDDAGDRPGMKALAEMRVLSPLRLCGLTKDEIRKRSREAGLFTWDKPAYACLATRIPSGMQITGELLARVEGAEGAPLFARGYILHMGHARGLEHHRACHYPVVAPHEVELYLLGKTLHEQPHLVGRVYGVPMVV